MIAPKTMLSGRGRLVVITACILLSIGLLFSFSDTVDSAWQRYTPGQHSSPASSDDQGVEDQHSAIVADVDVDNMPIAGGIPLRVLHIGASIARGEQSAGDVGYRKQLREWMAAQGNAVHNVGSQRFGDFKDNRNEAYGAHRIHELHDKCKKIVPQTQPNLMIVQIGTSDCWRNYEPVNIFTRYKAFVDYLLEAAPNTTVILSTLVTTPNKEKEKCFFSANAQMRQVALDLQREGKPIVMAEMHYDQGLPDRLRESDIGPDQIHPTNEGYLMMGEIFKKAIREADRKGFLQEPVDNGIIDDGEAARDADDEKAREEAARKKQQEEEDARKKQKQEEEEALQRPKEEEPLEKPKQEEEEEENR